jgi:hypothetical protein
MFSENQKTKKAIPIPTAVWAVGSAGIFLTLGFIAGGYVFGGIKPNSVAASMLSLLHTADAPDIEIPLTPQTQEVNNTTKPEHDDQKLNSSTVGRGNNKKQYGAPLPIAPPSPPTQQKKASLDNKVRQKKAQSVCAFDETTVSSARVPDVRINEVAWMGVVPTTEKSPTKAAHDEWIELQNSTDQPINISGWQIRSRTDDVHIVLPDETYIAPGGFVLLERSDDESVPTIPADVIYEGSLSNAGADIQLLTADCVVVDYVDAGNGWYAGNSQTKQTMERKTDGWQTSYQPGGTPKLPNSSGAPIVGDDMSTLNASTTATTTAVSPVSIGGSGGGGGGGTTVSPIVYPVLEISEIQTASASSTRHEFIEVYNPNPSAVSLDQWYMQKKSKSADSFSTLVPKELFLNKIIGARGYLIIANPSSSIPADVFSDYGIASDNTIVLKNPNGDIVDLVGMGSAHHCDGECVENPPEGASIRRIIDENGLYKDTDNNKNDFLIDPCPSPGSVVCSATYQPATGTATSTASSSQPDNTSSTEGSGASSTDPVYTSSTTATSTTAQSSSTETTSSSTIHMPKIIIIEVHSIGSSGVPTQDYIKLHNAEAENIDVSGWKLRKRTASGTESSIRVFPDGSVMTPGGSFLWAHTGDGFDIAIGANTGSTATIANDTSIAVLTKDGILTDSVAWGSGHTAPFVETTAFPDNPVAGQFMQRKITDGNYQDTDNNALDFELITTIINEAPTGTDATATSTVPI